MVGDSVEKLGSEKHRVRAGYRCQGVFPWWLPSSWFDDGLAGVNRDVFSSCRHTYPAIRRTVPTQFGEFPEVLSCRGQQKFIVGTTESPQS